MQPIVKFNAEQRGSHSLFSNSMNLEQIIPKGLRSALQKSHLIGRLESGEFNGYDYGNISFCYDGRIFVSCSQTSSKLDVIIDDFALIDSYDSANFFVVYKGSKIPSSETPFHYAIYKANPEIQAVIHGHIVGDAEERTARDYFRENNFPLTVSKSKTQKIADEVKDLIIHTNNLKVIGMLNHSGGFGLIAVGKDFNEAYQRIMGIHGIVSRRSPANHYNTNQ